MSDAAGGNWMAATAARYQTKVSVFNGTAGTTVKCLSADPRRWYVRFETTQSGGPFANVVPGPLPPGLVMGQTNATFYEWKFRDCPAVVTGEFFVALMLGQQMIIVEQLYVGE